MQLLFIYGSFMFRKLNGTIIQESTSSPALAFVGGGFFLEQGPSTHRNYISINSITFLHTVPGKLLFQIFAHKKTLIFWKSSVVLLKKFGLKTNEFILLNLEVCLSYLIMIIVEYRGDKPQMCRFIQEFYHHLLLMSRLDINFKNN